MTSSTQKIMSEVELRKFGVLLGSIILGLFGVAIPLLKGKTLPYWPSAIFLVLLTAAFLKPKSLFPLYRFWMRLGEVLGRINSAIILGGVFFLVIFPIGLLQRICGRRIIAKSFDRKLPSYFVLRAAGTASTDMEKPY